MKEKKLLRKKCPKCGKEIISLYPKQLAFNYKQHQKVHKKQK